MKITADLATFRVMFPEFDQVADATIEFWLDDCLEMLSKTNWSDCYDKAVLYYTAHNIALSQRQQAFSNVNHDGFVNTPATGVVSSMSDKSLSIEFSNSGTVSLGNDNQTWLQQTQYGQRYAALKKQCLPIGSVTG